MRTFPDPVTIRPSYPDDEATIRRLAALDSAPVPAGPFLLAEVAGEVLAAVSLVDGKAIADPFVPALHLVSLLQQYAADGHEVNQGHRSSRDRRRHITWRLAPATDR